MRRTRHLAQITVPLLGLGLALGLAPPRAEASGSGSGSDVARTGTAVARLDPFEAYQDGYRDGRLAACGRRGTYRPPMERRYGKYRQMYRSQYRRGYRAGLRAGCRRG